MNAPPPTSAAQPDRPAVSKAVSDRIAAKAARYLAEGRLTVRWRDGELVEATCRGSEAEPYNVAHDGDGWGCDCPAHGPCAHLVALQLVTGGAAE